MKLKERILALLTTDGRRQAPKVPRVPECYGVYNWRQGRCQDCRVRIPCWKISEKDEGKNS